MRLEGVRRPGLFLRLVYGVARRVTRRKTGTSEVPAPTYVLAHNRKILTGYGALEDMLTRSKALPPRLALLARERVAPMVGCHW